jgi:hypothetical protein
MIVIIMVIYCEILHVLVNETDVNAEEFFRFSAAMSRCVPWRTTLMGGVCDEEMYL